MKKFICASLIVAASSLLAACNTTATYPGTIPFKEPTKVVTCGTEEIEAIKVRRLTPFLHIIANEGKTYIRLDRDCSIKDYVKPEAEPVA